MNSDVTPGAAAAAELTGAAWRKSSRSSANGNCVEVAVLNAAVAVRDSKDPHGPALIFRPAEWTSFLEQVRAGARPSS